MPCSAFLASTSDWRKERGERCAIVRAAAVAWWTCRHGFAAERDEDLGGGGAGPGPAPSAARPLDARLDLRADDPVAADRPLSQREGTIRMQLDLAERHGHEQLAAALRDQLLRLGVDAGEVDDA
jgi:hypothetical protein